MAFGKEADAAPYRVNGSVKSGSCVSNAAAASCFGPRCSENANRPIEAARTAEGEACATNRQLKFTAREAHRRASGPAVKVTCFAVELPRRGQVLPLVPWAFFHSTCISTSSLHTAHSKPKRRDGIL